ncbi:MAG: putative lipid II flippase FtsW [Candidatus Eisenbacteria bacterium]|nr:putative lipid II flippase FtsW [Candidatus Eisenbacteria bacterium]
MTRGDRWIIVLALVLTAIGLVMVYSSSSFTAFVRKGDENFYLRQQAFRTLLGIGALWACARALSLKFLESLAPWLLGGACALLVAVVAVGHMSNGATRWLRVGMLSLQPTDLARVAAVVFLAWWLKRRPVADRGFWRGLVPPLLIVGGVAALILKQPNLSSAALLLATGFVMLFLSGAPLRHLVAPVAAGVGAAAVALATHPYMMRRVQTFADFAVGRADAHDAGFQLNQSLIAIGSGGLAGRGLGAGMQKLLFLPEAHTDFIFSIIAEELGFIGTTALLVVIGLFLWRGMRVAARCSEPFAGLVAGGLTVQIGLYALANLAVATGVAPTTGLPLPFVSYGGSALLVNLAAAGILYRISALNGESEALTRQRWAREGA